MDVIPYAVEFTPVNVQGEILHILDRQIESIEIDIRNPKEMIVWFNCSDKIQFGEKVYAVNWKVAFRFAEGGKVKVLK